jgi:hypothetical protein
VRALTPRAQRAAELLLRHRQDLARELTFAAVVKRAPAVQAMFTAAVH